MLVRPLTGLTLAACPTQRLRQDQATPSHALCTPTLLRRIMTAAQAMVITTGYWSRWRGGTPAVSRTEWLTPGQSPSMSEAMDISVLKVALRRTPITRLAMIGLCQDLIYGTF